MTHAMMGALVALAYVGLWEPVGAGQRLVLTVCLVGVGLEVVTTGLAGLRVVLEWWSDRRLERRNLR